MRVYLFMFENNYSDVDIECSPSFNFDEVYKNLYFNSYNKNRILENYWYRNIIICYYSNNKLNNYNSNDLIILIIEFLNMKIEEDIELITICFNKNKIIDFYYYNIYKTKYQKCLDSNVENKYEIEHIDNNIDIDKLNYLYENYDHNFVIMKVILYFDKKNNIKSANS